jgi:hypothetical protein
VVENAHLVTSGIERNRINHLRNVSCISGNVSGLRGDVSCISGNVSGLRGNVSCISGDVSGLRGNVSGLRGNVDGCEITDEERKNGIDIKNLIEPAPLVPEEPPQDIMVQAKTNA